jgi:hypothetical protein
LITEQLQNIEMSFTKKGFISTILPPLEEIGQT